MWNHWVRVVVVLCTLGTGVSGTRCRKYSTSYSWTTYYTYCPDLCCGSDGSQYCCDTLTVEAYVGISIGAIVFLGFLIALAVCACVKSGGNRRSVGTVITPSSQHTTVLTTTGAAQGPPPYPGAGQGPPPYPGTFPGHPAPPLPPLSDPAYPPRNPSDPPPPASYNPPKAVPGQAQ